MVGTLATAPGPAEAAPALPGPGESSVAGLLSELQGLYRRTEAATEKYNATVEALRRQRAEVKGLGRKLAVARTSLHLGRMNAGRLAREQYRGHSSLSPYLRLLFAPDPQQALDQTHVMQRAQDEQQSAVDRLTAAEHRAATLANASRKAYTKQHKLAARQKRDRDAVHGQLRRVEQLLAGLSPGQLDDMGRVERDTVRDAQDSFMASGALSSYRPPSKAGGRALHYAVKQIGKPYVWGATGPGGYDCSGLTSKAWAHAGHPIPRTSQEQWAQLEHVPLSQVRPGDLVVYFPGATHVALYIGDGLVVQAPRPGSRVKVSPIASNPPIGAVRPDPGSGPVRAWHPPKLPKGAKSGSDDGFQGLP